MRDASVLLMPLVFLIRSGEKVEPLRLFFRRQVVMDHCWESAAHSACFQIRSHQDMPTRSRCDKGAGLHADHGVLWRYRSAACAWPEPLKIRLMDGALQEWTDRTWGLRRKEKRCMFVFRLSWIECLDFEQLIIQQIFKGNNEIWRFSAGTIVAMVPKNIQAHIAATVCTCSPCSPPVHIPAGQPWWPERSFLFIYL